MQEYNKKNLGSGHNTATLIILNDETEDIIKIVKSLEDSGLLLKGVSETIQIEAKEQKGGFLSKLLGILGANLLGNILAGTGVNRAGYENKKRKRALAKRQGRGIIRAGYDLRDLRSSWIFNTASSFD